MLTKGFHGVLRLPANGPSRHPDGKNLAVDGRGRKRIVTAGIAGPEEKRGSLGWFIERTSDAEKANLEIDTVSWPLTADVSLPGAKGKNTSTAMEAKHLPGFLCS